MFGVKPLILTARHLMSMDPGPPTQWRPQNSLFIAGSAEDAKSALFASPGPPRTQIAALFAFSADPINLVLSRT